MPRKKYNPHKKSQKLDRLAIEDLMVVYVGGTSKASKIIFKGNGRVVEKVPQYLVDLILKRKYDWTVYCAVMGRDHQLSMYTKADEYYFQSPVLQDAIAPFLIDKHRELVEKQNQQHHLGIAWIACPYDTSIDEEFALDLFEKFGGFKTKAPWQINKID